MPRPKSQVPSLTLHAPTGQARVRIAGKDYYLGPFGTPEANERYRRLVAEYMLTGSAPDAPRASAAPQAGVSVNELALAFWKHATAYYVKNGRPTGEIPALRDSVRLLRELYGTSPAAEFGPLRLKALREAMIAKGWCRSLVNARIRRVKLVFKWGVANELVPPSVHHGLTAVVGLRKGRTEVRESPPVVPVPVADLNATLPHLNRQLAAMVKLQAYTGMRPGEICQLRPCDVNRDGDVWEYRPASHKTEHHGRERVVYLGPRAKVVLAPWLDDRPAEAFCFSPAEALSERSAALRSRRKTPVQPSQRNRRTAKPKRRPGERYTTMSYGHAIMRACDEAGVPRWSPNRLRHTAATTIRKAFGLEAAQVALGHAAADVTQVYAERDAALGRRVATEIG